MPSSRIPDPMSVQPMSVAKATDLAIDLSAEVYRAWLLAIAADVRRYWLDPYLRNSSGKKPPGYYFDLARVRRRS